MKRAELLEIELIQQIFQTILIIIWFIWINNDDYNLKVCKLTTATQGYNYISF
jgi:hypothetical protein